MQLDCEWKVECTEQNLQIQEEDWTLHRKTWSLQQAAVQLPSQKRWTRSLGFFSWTNLEIWTDQGLVKKNKTKQKNIGPRWHQSVCIYSQITLICTTMGCPWMQLNIKKEMWKQPHRTTRRLLNNQLVQRNKTPLKNNLKIQFSHISFFGLTAITCELSWDHKQGTTQLFLKSSLNRKPFVSSHHPPKP